MKHHVRFFVVLALACGCAPKPAESAKAEPAGGDPAAAARKGDAAHPDFDALFAREATGLVPVDVKGPGGAFTARVSSRGAPEAALADDVTTLNIPIGAESPVTCQVLGADVDPGGSFRNLFANAGKAVEFQRMSPWSVQVIDGAPAAFVRAVYLAPGSHGKSLGELKVMIHRRKEHSILCLHDEVGYEKTFLSTAAEFAAGVRYSGAKAEEPQLVEVQQISVQGAAIGFSVREATSQAGKRHHTVNAFIMLPVSEKQMTFGDYYEIQELDAALHVKSGVWVEVTDGKFDLKLKLDQVKGGDYKYAGESKGKPATGTFSTKDGKPLPGYALTARTLAAHAGDAKPFSVESLEYDPDVELAAPTPLRYFRNAGDPAGSVRIEKPKGTETGMLDAQGLMEKMSRPAGQSSMETTRLFLKGTP